MIPVGVEAAPVPEPEEASCAGTELGTEPEADVLAVPVGVAEPGNPSGRASMAAEEERFNRAVCCLLYTSDAADE